MIRFFVVVLTIATLTVAAGAAAAVAATRSQQPVLIDQTGRAFTLQSLRGRPLVITFVSAHCTDACPLIDAQFSQASKAIARIHGSALLVTITLDPVHDTLAVMRRLAQTYSADAHFWRVAGGEPADVDALLAAFGVVTKAGPDGYREAHSTFVYVFDARGNYSRSLLASTNLAGDIVDAVSGVEVTSR